MKTTLEPSCLIWARERAGLTTAELAEKMQLSEKRVIEWESTGEIDWHHIDRLAEKTYVPFGSLLLDKPIDETLPASIRDFRTVGSTQIRRVSPELTDTINTVLLRQSWYRDYVIDEGGSQLSFVGSLKVSDDVVSSAARIRETVNWETQVRSQASNWEDALRKQTIAVEKTGVLVMGHTAVGFANSRKLKVDEFRGFVLSDEFAPVIFLNNVDSPAARMFTLAHELVHIWIGEFAISNLNLTFGGSGAIERFCNNVAAELLVPESELKNQWRIVSTRGNRVSLLGNHFKVSSLVVLRRLRDLEYISAEEFQVQYVNEISLQKTREATKRGSSGGNTYGTLRSRLGRSFSEAVCSRTLNGATTYREAFSLTSLTTVSSVNGFASFVMEPGS